MIPVDKSFSFQRTADCWILHHHYMSSPKEGEPKKVSKKTYHGTLQQACATLVDKSLSDVPRVRLMMESMHELQTTLEEYVNEKQKEKK